MVHGASLIMTAVRENLSGQLLFKYSLTLSPPYPRLNPIEVDSGKYQCLCIGEQVVAQEVILHPAAQPSRLHGKTIVCALGQLIAGQRPFDPVYDTQ